MQRPRNLVPQEVPEKFARQLRELRDNRDPRLNALLAAARSAGWRTATLASILGMKATACSKRIERAEPLSREAVARQALRTASRMLTSAGHAKLAGTLLRDSDRDNVEDRLPPAAEAIYALRSPHLHARRAAREVEKAIVYRPAAPTDIRGLIIPPPRRVQAMMNGQRLPLPRIEALKEMQETASKVNGALAADHPYRKVSEDYTAELHKLISDEGFTPYYLAKELGVTHRAITSRLERHGYRSPCPSVAGTPSGVYRGRKIGDQADLAQVAA